MAVFTCDYCNQRKEIVQFIDDGLVPGVVNMPKKRPVCRECLDKPAIDGKPSEDEYPF